MANKKKKAAYNVRRIRDFRAKVMMLEEKVKALARVNWILGDEIMELKDVLENAIYSDDGIECLREWAETGVWPQ
jgi:predicted RNase H-like nuclease (RuvC/YqgF family)